ncbi:MAG: hypothetical protein ABFE07_28480 [Armatimonadia bacterium]
MSEELKVPESFQEVLFRANHPLPQEKRAGGDLRGRIINFKFESAMEHLQGASPEVEKFVRAANELMGNSGWLYGWLGDLFSWASDNVVTRACGECGRQRLEKFWREQNLPYGLGDDLVNLTVNIPVYRCLDCGFEFTDYEADEAKDAAVRKHLESKAAQGERDEEGQG